MQKISDVKVTKAILNERQELSVNLLIKKGDFSNEGWTLLREAKINGDLLDFEIVGMEKNTDTDIEKKKELTQKLAGIMSVYAEKSGENINALIEQVRGENKVTSRADMSIEQLERAIENFRIYLREYE